MKPRTSGEWGEAGVWIGGGADPARIAADAVLHPGTRIAGAGTSIGPGCVVGGEGAAVIENCQLGRNVELKGGYFSGSVFLDGAGMGGGAHVRPGCILEEQASGAHAVGLKQTILFPFATLGSLVNFCDVLLAGGTSRRNHSEVGSSYVHFNFTPHQDKATASLVGDVPGGVFLDQDPVFLGGQGGLVGPARIAYGTVVAAGGVCRGDIAEPNRLHVPAPPEPGTRPYPAGVYRKAGRLVRNNLAYIGNILALREWYGHVRARYLRRDAFDRAVLEGALGNLGLVLAERIRRLGELAGKMDGSAAWLEANGSEAEAAAQRRFLSEWPSMEAALGRPARGRDEAAREAFLRGLPEGGGYLDAVRGLAPGVRAAGRGWLESIVQETGQLWR